MTQFHFWLNYVCKQFEFIEFPEILIQTNMLETDYYSFIIMSFIKIVCLGIVKQKNNLEQHTKKYKKAYNIYMAPNLHLQSLNKLFPKT